MCRTPMVRFLSRSVSPRALCRCRSIDRRRFLLHVLPDAAADATEDVVAADEMVSDEVGAEVAVATDEIVVEADSIAWTFLRIEMELATSLSETLGYGDAETESAEEGTELDIGGGEDAGAASVGAAEEGAGAAAADDGSGAGSSPRAAKRSV